MKYQITEIEFDFDEYDDAYPDELDDTYKQQVTDETIGQIWDADDEFYQQDVDLLIVDNTQDVLDVDHPIIRF